MGRFAYLTRAVRQFAGRAGIGPGLTPGQRAAPLHRLEALAERLRC